MLIPLPFNDSVVIRFFEPTEMKHACARGIDIIGVSYNADQYRDAIGVTASSTFAHPDLGSVKDIQKQVDDAISADVETPTDTNHSSVENQQDHQTGSGTDELN